MNTHRTSLVVWPWREQQSALPAPVATLRLRSALIRALLMLVAAAVVAWRYPSPWPGLVLATIALLVLAFSVAMPAFDAGMAKGEKALTRAVTATTTHILLTPVYYLCFAPVSAMLRCRGVDPMKRTREPKKATYWNDHGPTADPQRYARQY